MDSANGEVAPGKSFEDIPEEAAGEDMAPQKKVLKPPMPPSKENKPSENHDSESKDEEPAPQKKILMPPSKEQKPSEKTEKEKESQEDTVVKPPMPPLKENKPRMSASGHASDYTASENGESGAATTPGISSPVQVETVGTETIHPPSPPSKDIKPKQVLSLSNKENLSEDDEGFTSKENKTESENTEDKPFTLSHNVPKPQGVMWNSPSSPVEKSSVDQNAKKPAQNVVTTIPLQPTNHVSELKLTPHSTPESGKKNAAPPAPPKKKPLKPPVKAEDQVVQDDTVASAVSSVCVAVPSLVEKDHESLPLDETKEPKEGHEKVIQSLSNLGASKELDDMFGVEAEVKSIDSGQLSAEDSESSEQVTPTTDKLQSSLEVLDGVTSEEELATPDSKVQNMEDPLAAILTVKLEATMDDLNPVTAESTCSPQLSSPTASLNSSLKKRSASSGDLLDEMKGLHSKVSIELEKTGELLDKISPGKDNEGVTDPGILLARAMEKLKRADKFLKEAENFKEQKNKSNRTSW